ncbi:ribosomal protein L5 [Trichodelitschia bisporula]|uniref:Large ribosomal subunit protein uL5m n=1 Tax=Trichodelitschia bisporula TaxID=703511 RepID=A0A6G1I8Q3_9PEZI|nr:ribosomal protein L5 [Trichodelitschia bisporula]
MALREAPTALRRLARSTCTSCLRPSPSNRTYSSAAADDADLEPTSFTPPPRDASEFNPVGQSRARPKQLPASRYRFRSPKFYRGPLHPHQPPPPSDPSSRLFVPGPFSLPRLAQTYTSTIAPDMLAQTYTHVPLGQQRGPVGQRLRSWEGESPYFAGRPLRAPKGNAVLLPLHAPITFRNVPKIERVTVHTMASEAIKDSAYLHVAGMVVQAVTNVRAETHRARNSILQWGLKAGRYVSVTADLRGEDMHNFLAKVVEIVLPRIKEWRGLKGSSGDSTGNISFGIGAEGVALFPEVEVNYDMYPPKMIPGMHITVHTTAKNDKEARLLLSSIGLPFYGKLVN